MPNFLFHCGCGAPCFPVVSSINLPNKGPHQVVISNIRKITCQSCGEFHGALVPKVPELMNLLLNINVKSVVWIDSYQTWFTDFSI